MAKAVAKKQAPKPTAKKQAPKKVEEIVEESIEEAIAAATEEIQEETEAPAEVEEVTEDIVDEATEESPEEEDAEAEESDIVAIPTQEERTVVYPEIECQVFYIDEPLSVDAAKQLLGWTEPPEGKRFEDPDLEFQGKTIYLAAVQGVQRAISMSLAYKYAQDYLHRVWAGMREGETPNGEPIILGTYGHCIEGMHRLLALVIAADLYETSPDKYPKWDSVPGLTTILLTGISEHPRVLNTINTGKPRKLEDAIHTCGLFEDFSKRDKKKVCKAADFAIRTLWDHTGKIHAYGPRDSHQEALDFLERHPKLIEAINYCFAEEPALSSRGVKFGAMAALMYLMASSKSKPKTKAGDGYYDSDEPSESLLDMSLWGKAEKFISLYAQGDPSLKALYAAIDNLVEKEDGKTYGIFRTVDRNILYEKTCLIFKTWSCWLANQPITQKNIGLRYKTDEEGEKFLNEVVTCGGIDLGIMNNRGEIESEE